MVAVRLEKFTPIHSADIGARLVSKAELDAIRTEATEAGIRKGAEAASDAFTSEQSRCLSQIHEAIGDTYFAREEAHRLALGSLGPLVKSLAEAIAPNLCQSGLSAEIAQIAEDAARRAPESSLTVLVPPNLVEEIAAALKQSDLTNVVTGDPSLNNSQARVSWGGGFDLIDLEAAAAAAIDAIETFFNEIENEEITRVHNAS